MREPSSDKHSPAPWHVPVAIDDIAETGQHFDLVADQNIRAVVARVASLRDLPRFAATFDVTPYGASGLRVTGRVSATVGQTCVVTLEPLANEVEEDVDLLFAPPPPTVERTAKETAREKAREKEVSTPVEQPQRNWDEPEPLVGGIIDLGALAIEFLILGLDPYPRKPGAVFQPPQDVKPDPSPFAALAGLKDRDGR